MFVYLYCTRDMWKLDHSRMYSERSWEVSDSMWLDHPKTFQGTIEDAELVKDGANSKTGKTAGPD